MARIGFHSLHEPEDQPQAITLTEGTSNRLGKLLGTQETSIFSHNLEAHIAKLNTTQSLLADRVVELKQKLEKKKEELAEVKNKASIWQGLSIAFAIAFFMLFIKAI